MCVGLTGKGQTGEKLGYCLQVVFGCLIQWSDKSKSFRTTMLKEGLIFENIHLLNKLGSAVGNEVCMYVCMYVCTYVCMYVRTYVHTYVCMYACISLYELLCNSK